MKFRQFLSENISNDPSLVNEVMITLGKKLYPQSGHVVLLCGGGASGKGFVTNKLLGIEGAVLDVDALKKMALDSNLIKQKIKDKTGYDVSNFDLKNPDNVTLLHAIFKEMKIDDIKQRYLLQSVAVAAPDRKPNIIFDVTLKDIGKFVNITHDMALLGYPKENIHIVWVLNTIDIAKAQNKERSRVVPEDILISTHQGAALTMKSIIDMGDNVTKYMNGTIVIAFNDKTNDTVTITSELPKKDAKGILPKMGSGKTGSYLADAFYIVVKKAGSSINPNAITNELLNKIRKYVPVVNTW